MNKPFAPEIAGWRVLIADDFEMGRLILKRAATAIGWTDIEEAEDGAVALAKLQAARRENRQFSLVFCDWTMPELSGLDVLKTLRADEAFAKTLFVMVTATSDRDSVIRALEAGANDYITKPIAAEALAGKIERLLGNQLKAVG